MAHDLADVASETLALGLLSRYARPPLARIK